MQTGWWTPAAYGWRYSPSTSPSHDHCGMRSPSGTSSTDRWYRDIVVTVVQAKLVVQYLSQPFVAAEADVDQRLIRSSRSLDGPFPGADRCRYVVESIYGLDCGQRGGGGSRNWWAGGEFGG